MKKFLSVFLVAFMMFSAKATIHTVKVWNGYLQFLDPTPGEALVLQLGDTIQWLPLDQPTMVHTVTSSNIPNGAAAFDYIWQAPADTFFQYIPQVVGAYDYVCTPHEVTYNMVGTFEVQDSTVGILQNEPNDDVLKVYPNPVVDVLQVEDRFVNASFQILNLQGQIVLKGIINSAINVSNLPEGVYILELLADKLRYTKFTKEL